MKIRIGKRRAQRDLCTELVERITFNAPQEWEAYDAAHGSIETCVAYVRHLEALADMTGADRRPCQWGCCEVAR